MVAYTDNIKDKKITTHTQFIMNAQQKAEIQNEIINAQIALSEGNEGKARVCARRAVLIVIQETYSSSLGIEFSAMTALRFLVDTTDFPESIRMAAERLQGGLRAKIEGNVYSENPINDAEIIIRYFG